MIGIHPVHRRLAELALRAKLLGDFKLLSPVEKQELSHCLSVNLELVRKLDSLKSLAFIAYDCGDVSWHQDICAEIEALESKLL
ncbi:hypothetical protein I6N90_14680 [Paenibacillus sp. GSMTC-2017]|uniref:DUF7667 family protein n=1 Tax=Paenibacillus sp. GSMTC-2017 TaxID=2794350 RepID=UPI0018D78E28|nr:hypothetical protein [Paenibacillus sp. GSMTC-2017]MBH5319049.1 hypothetical protein [Paenibacillus sp. GSMTC-2017]